ncbi:MAG TPA: hypothetical protein VG844_01525 [Terracidiphilus sp.]|nr:hypothetical protein [Terracidiphilus sp.]
MNMRLSFSALSALFVAAVLVLVMPRSVSPVRAASHPPITQDFHTSDRCVACHNGLKTSSGEDISIGFEWRASIMANSGRDPYWQASIRRETIDHPESSAFIQDDCSTCHMPLQHLIDKAGHHETQVLARLPLGAVHKGLDNSQAADGVTCAVCHQIESTNLGTPQSYNGNFVVAPPDGSIRKEYGPFVVDKGHLRIMQSSTAGYTPTQAQHIRDSALCGSCHTLYTTALGPGGKTIGQLPEQMPYLEWLHSDYKDRQTCQQCHMPEVHEAVAVTALYGQPREGMHRHTFVGANFLLEGILNAHRNELDVAALPQEFNAATARTKAFLTTQAAHVAIGTLSQSADELSFPVTVDNLTGHKLPTAYPSRRAWLHVTVTDNSGNIVFESGKLNPDGSIVGNVNDSDPHRYMPHYTEITKPGQVEIFEAIMGDSQNRVTTGLLTATHYLKDNRLLPTGFDKQTAQHDIAVIGSALGDPGFTGGSARVLYRIPVSAAGPLHVSVELVYQPVGYRWAHNLAPYQSDETQRFVGYYKEASAHSSLVLAHADATTR